LLSQDLFTGSDVDPTASGFSGMCATSLSFVSDSL
jgi:hypothetical protein